MIDDKEYEASKEEVITGMGVYNAANIEFTGIVPGQRPLTEDEIKYEYETGDIQGEK